MIRIIVILLIIVTSGLLLLQGRLLVSHAETPIFMQTDALAKAHTTKIELRAEGIYKPDSVQAATLKADYSNLWAHLNHLYATNDVISGKEYYTEPWFKQICSHYPAKTQAMGVTRQDLSHQLVVKNWSSDGLICTLIDSNIVFQYRYPDKSTQTTKATVAMVLLYQGDHWRIDAMRVISEERAD